MNIPKTPCKFAEKKILLFNIDDIRAQFPILSRQVGKYPLVYFDNGATAQKPLQVIEEINQYYSDENANIHRGVHFLSQLATEKYEQARNTIQQFINAHHAHEIIFTSGTTGSINLVASSIGKLLNPGDEIIITQMEHHSNIVPWQMIAEEKNLKLKYIPITPGGELELKALDELITEKTKLISVVHVSNSLGTINPIEQIIEKAHKVGAWVMVDAAQSIQHEPIDVQKLDCDFLVFSGHKIFGPTGTGILYGKEKILDQLPPYQGGGDMIKTVTMEKTTYNELPHKFEAGTPHISGGIAMASAINWLQNIDRAGALSHEQNLLKKATDEIQKIEGIKIFGTAKSKAAILSFLIDGTHPYDIGTLLNQQGIAVRTGHHCTQPVMDYFGIPGTIRASFSLYNTADEIDYFIKALDKAVNMLRG